MSVALKNVNPNKEMQRFVLTKGLRRTRLRSMSGAWTRHSTAVNAVRPAADATRSETIAAEDHPQAEPLDRASSSATRLVLRSSAPAGSSATAFRAGDSGTRNATPTNTLTPNPKRNQ